MIPAFLQSRFPVIPANSNYPKNPDSSIIASFYPVPDSAESGKQFFLAFAFFVEEHPQLTLDTCNFFGIVDIQVVIDCTNIPPDPHAGSYSVPSKGSISDEISSTMQCGV